MTKPAAIPFLALALTGAIGATAVSAAIPMLYEEQMARAEEALIITAPIAGIGRMMYQ